MMGQIDNTYQQECLSRYPGRFASIVIVDTTLPDAPQHLTRLAEAGASGVRLRPDARSPGDDPLAIWRHAAQIGVTVSCLGAAADFAEPGFAELLAELPGLKVVIEHLGGTTRPDADDAERKQREIVYGLARFPNLFIKFGGLGEFALRASPPAIFPFELPLPAYLAQAHAAFGPERMMWGSDFPPVAAREGYYGALRLSREQFESESAGAREQMFGATAARVFAIR
jgi:L-fuconolactonase